MTNSSISNIDQFIQAQKDKLRKDRYSNTPTRLNENRYNDYQTNNATQNLSPRAAIKQAHPSPSIYVPLEEQLPVQSHRITRVYPEKENVNETFFNNFGKYEQKQQKLKRDLHEEYNNFQRSNKKNFFNKQSSSEISKEFYATLPLGQNNRNERPRQQIPAIADTRRNFPEEPYLPKREYSNLPPEASRYDNLDPYRALSAGYINDTYQRQTSSHSLNQPQRYQPSTHARNDQLEMLDALDNRINQAPVSNGRYMSYGNDANLDPSLSEILRRPPVYMNMMTGSNQSRQVDNYHYEEHRVPQPPSQPTRQEYSRQQALPQLQNDYAKGAYSGQETSRASDINRKIQTESNIFNYDGVPKEDKYKDKSQKVREYQEELQRQIREKQLKKQKEKEIEEKIDKKILDTINDFSPFGRGGGGAPLKDRDGNPIADLSRLKHEAKELNEQPLDVQRQVKMQQLENEMHHQTNGGNQSQRGAKMNNANPNGDEPSYARGGNGIFGEAKTEVQKRSEEKYKAELKRQIEEKKEREMREKERLKIEDEKEMKRIEEQQKRIKAELEEEERKKREKEQVKNTSQQDQNLAVVQKRKEAQKGRKLETSGKKSKDIPVEIVESKPYIEFRSNSPPIPTLAKKGSGEQTTKSNLKKSSKPLDPSLPSSPQPDDVPNEPVNKKKSLRINIDEQESSAPVTDYYVTESRLDNREKETHRPPMATYRKNYPSIKPHETNRELSRPPSVKSQGSSMEVLKQLQSLKKHLHNEQMIVENELNNTVSVGQMIDNKERLLRVKTPDDPFYEAFKNEPVGIKRETSDLKTKMQRKILDDRAYAGGNEPKTYFREGSVTLKDDFEPILMKKKSENNIELLDNFSKPSYANYDTAHISTRNEQRLRKLRDLEGDNLSIEDPNEVLNKFLNRNKRRPSITTLQDDTWEKNQF